jgi:type IV pilus assembly protein PilQ
MLATASLLAGATAVPWSGTSAQSLKGASQAPAAQPTPGGSVQLKVRRLSDAVELVIEGAGPGPRLSQGFNGSSWQGQLNISTPNALKRGPQRLSIPELGLQLVTFSGGGQSYQIDVTPTSGLPLNRPVVSADGQNMILTFATPTPSSSQQTARPNLNQPGAIPQPTYAPPLQPRASAPPVGDMAVGTMVLRNSSYVNLRGPRVTMTLRDVPAKLALMTLTRLSHYGFVYIDDNKSTASQSNNQNQTQATGQPTSNSGTTNDRNVTISFVNEDYSRAVNAVLLASGLSAKLEGNLLIAGSNVASKGFGARLSKVYRLNQVSANSAADYLANLGASVTKTNTITTSVSTGATQTSSVSGAPSNSTTQTGTTTNVESYGASQGPLIGLQATTDSRLGTITLVGDAAVVGIAEQYLKQLDLRQRQVALSVRILDITLGNDLSASNSFAFRYGNNFIVNDEGRLLGAFGGNLPPTTEQFQTMAGGASSAKPVQDVASGQQQQTQVVTINPVAPAPINPSAAYTPENFYNFVKATIESSSTKILASPTLILSENAESIAGGSESSSSDPASFGSNSTIGRPRANEAFVTVGENVITSYEVTANQNSVPATCQPEFSIAGLTFGARINKIDDNGFVTFSLSPAISAATRTLEIKNCGFVDILAIRRLDTGTVRVRDGQTLILTGVISDSDIQTVRKWPILGDIPLVGQFFRSSGGSRDKRELVIMVTPRIINDETGGVYGYGYQPSSRQTREMMGTSLDAN